MGSPADWASGTPTGFSGAVTRWKDGFLAAWLRQHGFAQQAQSAAAAATGVPGVEAAFDVYLRHLHPLAPCEVTFDTGSLQTALTVPYGQSREIDVPYWTHGVGFPVGAVDLENAPPGLTLKEQRLTRREGNLRIGLDTRADMPAGFDSRQAQLRVAAGNFVIAGSLVPVPYRVLRPVGETVVRVLVGAVAGVALLGGSRLLAETFLPRAVAMADFDSSTIWKATTEWKLGVGGLFIGGFLIVVGAMVAGFYGFLAAWRKSEA
ncbi:hypothetical protein EON79_22030 [bacterium]|nr:MAG: hypothetical protein EON79_22030 [bacterium]